jgi:hypothetical protein
LETARTIPIRAELIDFLRFDRPAPSGFVDFQFFFGRLFILATSGWYFRASLRNALRISSSVAVFGTRVSRNNLETYGICRQACAFARFSATF